MLPPPSSQRDAGCHVDPETIDETGRLDDGIRRQIGDHAVVLLVEVSAIDAARLDCLKDIARMLAGALVPGKRPLGALEHGRELGLEPVAVLGGETQIAARFAMNPVRHVDPFDDLVGTLSIPGQILGKMAVAFRRIDTETLQNIDADFLLLADDRMTLEGCNQFILADLAPFTRTSMNHVWWLIPEQTKSRSSCATPRTSAICSPPCCTPWHRPIVSTLP